MNGGSHGGDSPAQPVIGQNPAIRRSLPQRQMAFIAEAQDIVNMRN